MDLSEIKASLEQWLVDNPDPSGNRSKIKQSLKLIEAVIESEE